MNCDTSNEPKLLSFAVNHNNIGDADMTNSPVIVNRDLNFASLNIFVNNRFLAKIRRPMTSPAAKEVTPSTKNAFFVTSGSFGSAAFISKYRSTADRINGAAAVANTPVNVNKCDLVLDHHT